MSSLLSNLERRFSTTRYLRGSASTDLVRAGGGVREWIVGRELCLYALIDCAAVPPKKRHGFVEIAVRRLAPFPDPECHVVWGAQGAMVWIWPRSRMSPDEEGVPLRTDNDLVHPESIFLGEPLTEGAILQATSRGFEGRIWRGGVLVASRWWPTVPDRAEWGAFGRGAGEQVLQEAPTPAPFLLQERPWSNQRERDLSSLLQQLRTPLAVAAAFVLATALAWQAGGLVRLAWARSDVAQQTARLNGQLGNILNARDSALRDAAWSDRLLGLRPPMRQTALMARVAALFQDTHAQVVEWNVPERGALALTLRMANPNPESLVKTAEGSGLLTGVTSDTAAAGEIVLRGRVVAAKPSGGTP